MVGTSGEEGFPSDFSPKENVGSDSVLVAGTGLDAGLAAAAELKSGGGGLFALAATPRGLLEELDAKIEGLTAGAAAATVDGFSCSLNASGWNCSGEGLGALAMGLE